MINKYDIELSNKIFNYLISEYESTNKFKFSFDVISKHFSKEYEQNIIDALKYLYNQNKIHILYADNSIFVVTLNI